MITLCKACGTSYEESVTPLAHCKICEDERQYVPQTGQQWISLDALRASHLNKWQSHGEDLLSVKTIPSFAINQRAFIVRTAEGNILWDCIANLDEATKTLVTALGGLKAIALSHPHYYTTMQDWAAAFDAPVYVHEDDSEWIMRDSPAIKRWRGEALQLTSDVQIIRLGGHFAGGCVLHWDKEEGVLLAGDILQVTPGADRVSFMWSYPNMLPLSAAAVAQLIAKVDRIAFDSVYGAFEKQDIKQNAKSIVLASGQKYIACLEAGTLPS